ncbi:MAG: OmpA/MotB domain protein [Acidimicrobiaceae bacterium]|nr:OmpA/MotB domain protein [Acidimicrobiaceae bacterium]
MSYSSPLARSLEDPGNEHDPGSSNDRWLLTYSDMITLLLVLFIVLYALSSLNKVKYAEFQHGVARSFTSGTRASSPKKPTLRSHGQPATGKPIASLRTVESALASAIARAGYSKDVTITRTADRVIESFVSGKLFFANGEAALSALGIRVVDVSASVITRFANPVDVDGYANNVPVVGGPYANNWVLSSVRADNVVSRLSADGDPPAQLLALGFGQYHPVAGGTSAASLAANRRVNIVILTKRTEGQ